MKYAIVRQDGVTELRQDNGHIPSGALELTDEQYDQLCSGDFVLSNGSIVPAPSPSGNVAIINQIETLKSQFTDTLQMKALTGDEAAKTQISSLLSQINALKAQLT